METTEAFRLQINRGGSKVEVAAPGTVLCMRCSGPQPGFREHGGKGTNGGQHYVPSSVYVAIKGGQVEGVELDAEAAARKRVAEAEKQYKQRMQARNMAGNLWGMGKTSGEQRLKLVSGAEKMSIGELQAAMHPEAVLYLSARLGHPITELPYCIRSVPKLGYYLVDDAGEVHKDGDWPAMLAAAISPDDKVVGVHRFYLAPDSRSKRPGVESKKFLGDLCPGAAIRLGTKEEFENPKCVIVCEGLETGMALRRATGLPVLCVLSTAGLINLVLPALWTDSQLGKLERVIIAVDHDRWNLKRECRAGITAARIGANKLREICGIEKGGRVQIDLATPTALSVPGMIGEAPGRRDEFGDVLFGAKEEGGQWVEGKSVDWLDVSCVSGPDVVYRDVIGEERHGTGTNGKSESGNGERAAGSESRTRGVVDHSGGTEGFGSGFRDDVGAPRAGDDGRRDGAGAGGGEGGGTSAFGGVAEGNGAIVVIDRTVRGGSSGGDGSDDGEDDGELPECPPIIPDGHLAQARDFIRRNAAMSPLAEGRANQRWELVYMHEGKQWYRYEGTHYELVPESLLNGAVLHHFEPYYRFVKPPAGQKVQLRDGSVMRVKRAAISTGNAKCVVEAMQTDCGVFSPGGALPTWSKPTFDGAGMPIFGSGLRKTTAPPRKVIPYTNGLLRYDALIEGDVVLEPHTPNYVSTSCAPFDFPVELVKQQIERDPLDEEAGGELCRKLCPTFQEVLSRAAGDDEIYAKELMKYVGLIFTDDTQFEKILYQIGRYGKGKGTIFEGVSGAVGERNTYMSSAKQLTDKFETVNYIGKNLIGFDEFEAGHSTDSVEASRTLKTVGIGTATGVQDKFAKGYTTRITGKFWLISNKVARLRDSSAAMARRLLIFPMAGATPTASDPGIKRRVKAEARGIAIWAMFHLRILYREGRFVQPESGKQSLNDFKRLVSPVYAFASDCLVVGAGQAMEESLLRDLYVAYAAWTGVGRLGNENLYSELVSALDDISRDVDENGNRMIHGVRPRLADERGQKDTLYDDVKSKNRLADFGFDLRAAHEPVVVKTEYPAGGNGMFPPGAE